uniref:prepilin-type N-terminal cleavage/methylation domain-containing protein n=1 Tax=Pantoea sp. IMH TaxID=1267600 RepID=UPI0004B531A8|nr:prepilin-type N-terminal cleavage/methylation domain-containing protein [Pantoea sp. IMH]
MTEQHGFSLPEMLVALLLFATGTTAMMQYQLALDKGFQLHAEQREAWRQAWQYLDAPLSSGWQGTLRVQPGPAGCSLLASQVTGPAGRSAGLTLLRCAPAAQ